MPDFCWVRVDNMNITGPVNYGGTVRVEDSVGVYVAEEQVRRIVREEIERGLRALALAYGDRGMTRLPLIDHLDKRLQE